jgi:hypothetical protein
VPSGGRNWSARGPSQPRIAEIESGTTFSLESVMLAFFATGGSLAELAEVVASDG